MTIETHTTDRKALTRQISELLHEDAVYAGVPSCAYNVGPVTIDRSGAIHTDDPQAMETLRPFLIEQGWMTPEAEVIPDAPEYDSGAAPDRMEISVPAEGMTVTALLNLVHMLYSKQHLLNRATDSEILSISDGVIARLKEHTPETPDAFSTLLADFKALGELDGFDFQVGRITLTFPFDAEQPERWTAYGFLLDRIVKSAQAATRVHPERQRPENEKYFMRAWLLRLRFGGAEYKALRSLLLQNLKGNTAFPDDAAAEKHREKYADKRIAARITKGVETE